MHLLNELQSTTLTASNDGEEPQELPPHPPHSLQPL
jgi:hypothetical protein